MKTTKLIDVADIIYGYAFNSKLFNTSGEGRPLIRIRDVNTGFSNTYTTENAPEKYLVRNGDFLIGMDGNFEIVKWANGEALLNQRVCKIIPKSIKPDYLFYLLSPILKSIENKTHSTTVKHLSAKELNKISFELPNGDQQSKIANELSNLHRMLILKREALEGLDSLVKSRFMEMFGEWNLSFQKENWIKLSDLTNIYTGTTPKTEIKEYWNGLIPWVTPAELDKDSYIITDTERHITEKGQKSKSLTMMPIGTVLLSTRAPIGKVAICGVPMTCNQGFKNFECLEKLHPTYLFYLLKLNNDWLQTQGTGTTFKEISKSKAGNIRIPVPTMSDQKGFAQFYNLVDKSRFVVQKEIKDLQELLDSKMDGYFGGEE